MKINGTETREITFEVDPCSATDAIMRDWLKIIIGLPDAVIREGHWYRNWYAAHPDAGKPVPIRRATAQEKKIYDSLDSLKLFYKKVNR